MNLRINRSGKGYDQSLDLKLVGAIVFMALAIRLFWALYAPKLDPVLRNNQFHGDAAGYVILAINLLEGKGFTFDGIIPTAFRMPGYPAFLAVVLRMTNLNTTAVRITQAVLGALLVLPIVGIGKRLGGRTAALFSGVGIALYPLLIYMTGWIYSETLFILTLWLAIYVLLIFLYSEKLVYQIIAGILLGIASLIRPEVVIFPAFLMVVSFVVQRESWNHMKRLVCVQIITLIIVFPWSLRNYAAFKTIIPLTTSAGLNFHAGNNPKSNGGSTWVKPIEGLSESDSDRTLLQESLAWIRSNPSAALGLIPKKIYKFASPIEFETQSPQFGVLPIFINIIYWLFLSPAFYGWYKNRGENVATVILALVLWYTVFAAVFFGGSRVALPISPGWIIFSAAGFVEMAGRLK